MYVQRVDPVTVALRQMRPLHHGVIAGVWGTACGRFWLSRRMDSNAERWVAAPWGVFVRDDLTQPDAASRVRRDRWLRQVGLTDARFPTRRAAMTALAAALVFDADASR